MKFLKKASLAASIAAVSFAANAELVAMDEASMAAATGQAGVDIDITLGYDANNPAIEIGEIVYTDTAVGGDGDGGQIAISDISLSSADVGSDVVIYNAIDVKANGDIVMDSSATNANLLLSVGTVETRDSNGNAAANLVGGLDLTMTLNGGVTTISQNSGATTITSAGGSVQITDGSATLLNGAIGLSGIEAYQATAGADNVLGTADDGKTGLSTDHTLTFDGNGIGISDLDLAGTIEIAAVSIGSESSVGAGDNVIGSLKISDIALNNATIQISGH